MSRQSSIPRKNRRDEDITCQSKAQLRALIEDSENVEDDFTLDEHYESLFDDDDEEFLAYEDYRYYLEGNDDFEDEEDYFPLDEYEDESYYHIF